MENHKTPLTIAGALKTLLTLEQMMGADFVPRFPRRTSVRSDSLSEIRAKALACTRCSLHRTRTNVVVGVGDPKAPLMFIGEAPGADEDRQGEPFVGRAGMLLTKTLQKIGLRRESVYIANILKCRPPENRDPRPEEVISCISFLRKQIEAVSPKVVCALGRIAAQTLLGTAESMTRLRGKPHPWETIELLPTYHPAYVLRNMSALTTFENDIKLACKRAGMLG